VVFGGFTNQQTSANSFTAHTAVKGPLFKLLISHRGGKGGDWSANNLA